MALLKEKPAAQTSISEEKKQSTILIFDWEAESCRKASDALTGEGFIECYTSIDEARSRLARGEIAGAVIGVDPPESLPLLEEFAASVPTVILAGQAPDPKTLRSAIEYRARAYCPREEIRDLPRYLHVAQSSDDIETLWAIWLGKQAVYKNIQFPYGPDLATGEEGAFFEKLRSKQAQPSYSMELRDGVLIITHCDPPLNYYTPASIMSFYRLLRYVEGLDDVNVILYRSGLPPDYPPTATSRAARKLPFGLGRTAFGRFVTRALLRLRYPGMHKTRTLGAGMPLETLNDETMLAVTENFGIASFLEVFTYPKPIVILLEGLAVAGSFEMALCAHYLLATPRAMVSLPECKLAFPPPAGIPLLAYRVGLQRAFSIAADTRLIGAEEAFRLGVVDRVIPSSGALDEGFKHAHRLARSQAIYGYDYLRNSFRETLEKELLEGFQAWKRVSHTPEAQRRISAFHTKRHTKLDD